MLGISGVRLFSICCFVGLPPAISTAAGFLPVRFGLQQSCFFSGMLQWAPSLRQHSIACSSSGSPPHTTPPRSEPPSAATIAQTM